MSSGYPPNYPPPNSGIPPNQALPYAPPPTHDQWGRPLAAGYAQPPPGYQPAPPPNAPPYGAPPPGYGTPPPAYGQPGDVAFGDVAWSGGLPVGQYVLRIEDIEAGTSGAGNDKLVFTATLVQPANGLEIGRKAVWSYSLSEKAIGKLGRDVVNAGVSGTTRYPREPRGMAGALLQELRGVQIIVRSEEQRDGNGTNTAIVGRYNAASAPPAAAPPYTPPPVAGGGVPPISFPPNGQSPTEAPAGFHAV